MLLVVRDVVALHQREEILRRIARQCAFAKMRVLRQVVLWRRIQVGEIAAATAGNPDFFRQLGGMIDQDDAFAALAGNCGAHHAGSAGTDHGDIEL